MSKNLIESVHSEVGHFNGSLYFKLNNRLLVLNVGTPSFNDYSEWRIGDMSYALKDYDPSGDEVELKPLTDFTPIQLSDKEVDFLDTFATTEQSEEDFYLRCQDFKSKHNDAVSPWDYAGEPLLASYFLKGESKMTHQIFKNTGFDNDGIPSWDLDFNVNSSNWVNKKDISVNQGIYNILIPIMEAYVASVRT